MIWSLKEAKVEHHSSKNMAQAIFELQQANGKKVIDFGCGRGDYLAHLKSKGVECYGYEGTPDIEKISVFKPVVCVDLSKPLEIEHKGNVVCIEVAEHIPAEFENQLLTNITNACDGWLLLSWAVIGQGGNGHVNERDSEYVIQTVEKLGFKYHDKISDAIRESAGNDLWWFKKSVYFFTKL